MLLQLSQVSFCGALGGVVTYPSERIGICHPEVLCWTTSP